MRAARANSVGDGGSSQPAAPPRRRRRPGGPVVLAAGLLAVLARATIASAATPGPMQFGPPVQLTNDQLFGGYEPSAIEDVYGNIVVSAHKNNPGDVLSPDAASPLQVRAQSWLWTSTDGRHFTELPGMNVAGLPLNTLYFGDEGDMATDDAGHLYFVDTNLLDATISRWTAHGRGAFSFDFARPLIPDAQPFNDRPWVVAHGSGTVMYVTSERDAHTYAGGQEAAGSGPGETTVYMSYDGGQNFDPRGYTLPGSGWCRPAADHRPGSHLLYLVCTSDGSLATAQTVGTASGAIVAFVSTDDGRSFQKYTIAQRAFDVGGGDGTTGWPSICVSPDGSISTLLGEPTGQGTPHRLWLMRSSTQGRTWGQTRLDPAFPGGFGDVQWFSIACGHDNRLAVAITDSQSLATAVSGDRHSFAFSVVQKGMFPYGDFFQIAIGPDERVDLVWTTVNSLSNPNVLYARQR